jgi:hypothetical protein
MAAQLHRQLDGDGPTARARRAGSFSAENLTAAAMIGEQLLRGARGGSRVLGDGRGLADSTSDAPGRRDAGAAIGKALFGGGADILDMLVDRSVDIAKFAKATVGSLDPDDVEMLLEPQVGPTLRAKVLSLANKLAGASPAERRRLERDGEVLALARHIHENRVALGADVVAALLRLLA